MKFGILGAGQIAHDFVRAVALCETEHPIEILAVAAREKSRAQAFAAEYKIPRAYGSYEELMNDPEIDGIYIAVTHNFHAEIAKRCAEHKKAILCEKPFGINEAEVADALACFRKNNVLFMEAMWTRFLPTTLKAKEWIAAGKIGELQLIDASFCFYGDRDPKSRLYDPALAGGAFFDVGVYCVEFAMDFAGAAPKKIAGLGNMGPTGVDEMNALSMQFENGVLASLTSGTRTTTRSNGCLFGTGGSIVLPTFWGGTEALLYNLEGELMETFKNDSTKGRQGFVYEIEHFSELWHKGKKESPIMPHSTTLGCARVFDEYFKTI